MKEFSFLVIHYLSAAFDKPEVNKPCFCGNEFGALTQIVNALKLFLWEKVLGKLKHT